MIKKAVFSLTLLSLLFVSSLNAFAEQSQSQIDKGDTAWMIVSTALVMLMTVPGLALFYGGLVKKKDVLNTIAMSFVSYCIVSFLWIVYGYSLSFSGDIGGIIGYLDKAFLKGVKIESLQGTIPEAYFQCFSLLLPP